MKIIHIIIGLELGGAERMLEGLVQAMKSSACDVEHEVVSLTAMGIIGKRLEMAGFKVVAFDMKRWSEVLWIALALYRHIRLEKPDAVQTWMYHADLIGGLAAKLARVPAIIWGLHSVELDGNTSRLTRVIRRLCAGFSYFVPDKIVCVANAALTSHQAIGYCGPKMMVIPNGFDLSRQPASSRQACRKDLGLSVDGRVIGLVARFNHAKDIGNFVSAAGLAVERCPSLQFLMVGKGLSEDNLLLKRWIEGTGQSQRFFMLGERQDVPACLSAMDVFCLSSRTEAFPLVVGEAMVQGVPCIVTDVGDAAMMVGDTGMVVPKENALALSDAMVYFIEKGSTVLDTLGNKARERISLNFSMNNTVEKYLALYLQLTGHESRKI